MIKRSCVFFTLALMAPLVTQVEAKVADSSPGGFTIKHTMEVEAPPAGAFQAFVEKIGAWWDPQHTYSGSSANLSIEARPNGCFCEKLRSNGGIAHMTVVYADPGRILRYVRRSWTSSSICSFGRHDGPVQRGCKPHPGRFHLYGGRIRSAGAGQAGADRRQSTGGADGSLRAVCENREAAVNQIVLLVAPAESTFLTDRCYDEGVKTRPQNGK